MNKYNFNSLFNRYSTEILTNSLYLLDILFISCGLYGCGGMDVVTGRPIHLISRRHARYSAFDIFGLKSASMRFATVAWSARRSTTVIAMAFAGTM